MGKRFWEGAKEKRKKTFGRANLNYQRQQW
jgi:hypothetical protein